MEDGDISEMEVSIPIKETKELPNKMANYPDVEVTVIKNKNNTESKTSNNSVTKVNGESERLNTNKLEESDESDEDALIIDEDCKNVEIKSKINNNKRSHSPLPNANFKGFKKRAIEKSLYVLKIINEVTKTNHLNGKEEIVNHIEEPSIQGELNATISKDNKILLNDSDIKTDQKVKKSLIDANIEPQHLIAPSLKSSVKRPVKKNPSKKLTEYAQYLGLQPAVKFKCVKCSESSFPSLCALNEHQVHCLVQPQSTAKASETSAASSSTVSIPSTSTSTSTNFRITRKVYLCSSCGTYYETTTLFLHMRDVHRRYICLYCLGMFSLPEKLAHHLISKHNCTSDNYTNAVDFRTSYKESCFVFCCHCERQFSERDNFNDHVCVKRRVPTKQTSCWSCGVKDSTSHLETCKANVEQPTTSTNNQKSNSKSIHPKSQKHKTTKNNQKTLIPSAQHITIDTSSALVDKQNDEDKTGDHFLAAISSCSDTLLDNVETEMSHKSESPLPIDQLTVVTKTDNLNETSIEDSSKMNTCDDVINEIENKPNEIPISERNNIENDSCHKSNSGSLSDRKSINEELEERTESKNEMISDEEEREETDVKDNKTSEVNKSPESCNDFEYSDHERDFTNFETKDEEILETIDNDSRESNENNVVEETRKVPKVTLKLPPQGLIYSENESDDSEKLTMEVDENYDSDDYDESLELSKSFTESEKQVNGIDENEKNFSDQSDDDSLQIAGEEIAIIELELEQPLDKFHIEDLIKTCLTATIPTCIFCNHARKIAVNGKQLGLHTIAEHRFSATVNSITAEELIPKNFVQRIKQSLDEIESIYFSIEEPEKVEEEIKEDGMHTTSYKRLYECFQCRFVTTIHKELYLHNRKMHAKTVLLCIMCKSNFYSYSELICHLCPGNYVLNSETKFRCCMCESTDLPSAFRLMVHLRKRHHTCDVCLEGCQNQSKLSNHVWKHKLHHLCYRCGIAYRNKPDITKHLFWKHGTESVLCKKCLQKKWPHVYHFCVPPLSFLCEECNVSFSKAVYLKVHKRLHIGEKPHACTEEKCAEHFISKKLLLKHELKHREPIPIEHFIEPIDHDKENTNIEDEIEQTSETPINKDSTETIQEENISKSPENPEKEEIKPKNLIDVYDLPALNLSESDSDSEDEKPKSVTLTQPEEKQEIGDEKPEELSSILPVTTDLSTPMEEDQKPVPILDSIWDNFKNYQATKEKSILNVDLTNKDNTSIENSELKTEKVEDIINIVKEIMADHDYCLPETTAENLEIEDENKMRVEDTTGLDHDYCTIHSPSENNTTKPTSSTSPKDLGILPENTDKKKIKTPKKKSSSSSESSSDSDTSSCTCGSNCSCSSSSGGGGSSSSSSSSSDSDSSTSEGKRKIAERRERKKERTKHKKESETSQATNTSAVDVVATEEPPIPIPPVELPIEESDLDTDETETDEDFYDEYPQRLANKILAEKRNQLALLASVAPVNNGTILECSRPSTPSIPEETTVLKKKIKSKKRKKKSRSSTPKQEIRPNINIPEYLNHQLPLPVQSTLPITPIIQPTVPPLSIHSLPSTPQVNPVSISSLPLPSKLHLPLNTPGSGSETETSLRSSKRRRVPNKFYGYSSDEETTEKPVVTPVLKWRKVDLPTPPSHVTGSPQLVPPITIKNIPSPAPVVEPVRAAPVILHHREVPESDSETEQIQHLKSTSDSSDDNRNDDSDSDAGQLHISQPPTFPSVSHHGMGIGGRGERSNENLYCYCQCPYDEVSEMIACDGKDCAIEWFHFECVGIMVPPKGKWFCPDCRKKNSHRSDIVHQT